MAHYLDPKSDLVFKRIFGEHKNLCISLLNSMLPLEDDRRIVSIEYNPIELVPEIDIFRNSVVDVRCTDNHKRQFIVEMQMHWTESFKKRVLFNASKAYVIQLDKKDDFNLLEPVYALSFINATFDKSPEYYHHYKIVNIHNTEQQIKGLEFIFIELSKFRPQNIAERKLHELWLRFLTEIEKDTQEIAPELFADEDIEEAIKYAEIGAYTREELNAYYAWRLRIVTARSAISDYIEQGVEKGIVIGRTEGLEEGIVIGKAEGKAEGLEEGLEKGAAKRDIAIARNLLTKGFSIENIADITGLTIEEIEKLK